MAKETYYSRKGTNDMGEKGLAVMALYLSGLRKEDKDAKKAMDYLRTLDLTRTYCVSILIMAIEAYYTPLYEIHNSERRLTDKRFKPKPRNLSREDGEWMSKAVKWLIRKKS